MMDFKDELNNKEKRLVLKRLFSYLRPLKPLVMAAILLSFLALIFDLLGPLIIKHLLDNFIDLDSIVMKPISINLLIR